MPDNKKNIPLDISKDFDKLTHSVHNTAMAQDKLKVRTEALNETLKENITLMQTSENMNKVIESPCRRKFAACTK